MAVKEYRCVSGESDWPDSQAVFQRIFAGVPQYVKLKMVAGNAVEFFHLHS